MDQVVRSNNLADNADFLQNIQSAVNSAGVVGRVEIIETDNGPMTVIFMDDGTDPNSMANTAGETQYVFEDGNQMECEVVTSDATADSWPNATNSQTVIEGLETTVVSQSVGDYDATDSLPSDFPVTTEFIAPSYECGQTTSVTYQDTQNIFPFDTGQSESVDVVDSGTVFTAQTSSHDNVAVAEAFIPPEDPSEKFIATPLYQYDTLDTPLTIDVNNPSVGKKPISSQVFATTQNVNLQSQTFTNSNIKNVSTGVQAGKGTYLKNVKHFSRPYLTESLIKPSRVTRKEELEAVESIVAMDTSEPTVVLPSKNIQNTAIVKSPSVLAINEKTFTAQQKKILIPKFSRSSLMQTVQSKAQKSKSDMVQVIRTVQKVDKPSSTDTKTMPRYVYKVVKPASSQTSAAAYTGSDKIKTSTLTGSGLKSDQKPKVIQLNRKDLLTKGDQSQVSGIPAQNVTFVESTGRVVPKPETATTGVWRIPAMPETVSTGSSAITPKPHMTNTGTNQEPQKIQKMYKVSSPFLPKPVVTSQRATPLLPKPDIIKKGATSILTKPDMTSQRTTLAPTKPEAVNKASAPVLAKPQLTSPGVTSVPAKPQMSATTQASIQTIEVPDSDVKIQIYGDGTLVTCDNSGTNYSKINLDSLGLDTNLLKEDTNLELVIVQADGKEVRASIQTNLLALQNCIQNKKGNETVKTPANDTQVSCEETEPKASVNEEHISSDRPYKCLQCPRTFKFEKTFKNHESVHQNDVNFTCPVCTRVFAREENLETHLNLHEKIGQGKGKVTKSRHKQAVRSEKKGEESGDSKRFDCEDCGKAFSSHYSLSKHMLDVHTFNNWLACPVCDKLFKSETACNMHMIMHEDSLRCQYCQVLFQEKKELENHLRSEHSDEIFECVVCRKVLKSRVAYDFHLQKIHPECEDMRLELLAETYKCKECGKGFKRKSTLKRHMLSHTKKILQAFQCPHCPHKFGSKYSLKKHVYRLHKNNTSYSCDKCCMKFKRKDFFRTHVKRYHTGPYICATCEKEYQDLKDLVSHRFTEHGVGIPCNICSAQFEKKIDLMKHKDAEHRKQVNQLCDVCGAGFFHKARMKAHLLKEHFEGKKEHMLRVYPGMKSVPEECEICKIMLKTQVVCKMHYLNMHFNGKKEAMYKAYPFLKLYPSITEVLVCDHCGKLFSKLSHLQSHLRSNGLDVAITKQKKQISRTSETSENDTDVDFSTFTTRDTPKPYKCSECKLRFARKAALLKHMSSHEEDGGLIALRLLERDERARAAQEERKYSPKKAVVESLSPKKVTKNEASSQRKKGKLPKKTIKKGEVSAKPTSPKTVTKAEEAPHLKTGRHPKKITMKRKEEVSAKQTSPKKVTKTEETPHLKARRHPKKITIKKKEEVSAKPTSPKKVTKTEASSQHKPDKLDNKIIRKDKVSAKKVKGNLESLPKSAASKDDKTAKPDLMKSKLGRPRNIGKDVAGELGISANKSPRKRGRPQKVVDREVSIVANKSPGKRGRPRKLLDGENGIPPEKSPGKCGRPSKIVDVELGIAANKLPGKHGRPRKVLDEKHGVSANKLPRKRGRPAKTEHGKHGVPANILPGKRGRPVKTITQQQGKPVKTLTRRRERLVKITQDSTEKVLPRKRRRPKSLGPELEEKDRASKKRKGASDENKKSARQKSKVHFKCKVCNKTVKLATSLKQHMQISHSEKNKRGRKPKQEETGAKNKGNIAKKPKEKHERKESGDDISRAKHQGEMDIETFLGNHFSLGKKIAADDNEPIGKESTSENGNDQNDQLKPHTDIKPGSDINVNENMTISSEPDIKEEHEVVDDWSEGFQVAKYPCRECGNMYSTSIGILTHCKYKHPSLDIESVKAEIAEIDKATLSTAEDTLSKRRSSFEIQNDSIKSFDESRVERVVKDDKLTFRCKFCYSGYSSENGIKKHLELFHPMIKNTKEKGDCKSDTSCIKTEKNGQQQYSCSFCPKVFSEPTNLSRHMVMKHKVRPERPVNKTTQKLPFACKHCSRTFAEESNLGRHIKMKHLIGKMIGKRKLEWSPENETEGRTGLKTRYVKDSKRASDRGGNEGCETNTEQISRPGVSPIKCKKCSKTFPLRKRYMLHMKRDHATNQRMSTHSSVVKKLQTHIAGEYSCGICLKTFTKHIYYKLHLRKHKLKDSRQSSESPSQTYCVSCDKKFTNHISFNIHLRQKHIHEMLSFSSDKNSRKKEKPSYVQNKMKRKESHESDTADGSKVKNPKMRNDDASRTKSDKTVDGETVNNDENTTSLSNYVEYFFCADCKRPFWSKQKYTSHSKNVHPDIFALELDRMVLQQLQGTVHKAEASERELELMSPKPQRSFTGPMKHKCEFCHKVHWTKKSFEEHMMAYHAEEIAKNPAVYGPSASPTSRSPKKQKTKPNTLLARFDNSAPVNFDQLSASPVVVIEQLPIESLLSAAEISPVESDNETSQETLLNNDADHKNAPSTNREVEVQNIAVTESINSEQKRGDQDTVLDETCDTIEHGESLTDDGNTQQMDCENTASNEQRIEHSHLVLYSGEKHIVDPTTSEGGEIQHVQFASGNENVNSEDNKNEQQMDCNKCASGRSIDQNIELCHTILNVSEDPPIEHDTYRTGEMQEHECISSSEDNTNQHSLETRQDILSVVVEKQIENEASKSCEIQQIDCNTGVEQNAENSQQDIGRSVDALKRADTHSAMSHKEDCQEGPNLQTEGKVSSLRNSADLMNNSAEMDKKPDDRMGTDEELVFSKPSEVASDEKQSLNDVIDNIHVKNVAETMSETYSAAPVGCESDDITSDKQAANIEMELIRESKEQYSLFQASVEKEDTVKDSHLLKDTEKFVNPESEIESNANEFKHGILQGDRSKDVSNSTVDQMPRETEPCDEGDMSVSNVHLETKPYELGDTTNVNAHITEIAVESDDEQVNAQVIPHATECETIDNHNHMKEDTNSVDRGLQKETLEDNKLSEHIQNSNEVKSSQF